MAFHTPHGSTRFRLPWSWSSFDYRELCRALWEQCDARFEIAKVEGARRARRAHRPRRAGLAPLIVDALGWRRVLGPGANVQPPEAAISRGLEVHPHGGGADLDVWIDRSLVRYGYGWRVPADGEQRVGVGSYEPRHHVKEPTVDLARRLDVEPVRYQGNWFPHRLRPAAEDGVFFVGDSAGHCFPLSGEGIRTAFYFGIAAGRELRAVLAGERTRDAGAGPLRAFSRRATRPRSPGRCALQRRRSRALPPRALHALLRGRGPRAPLPAARSRGTWTRRIRAAPRAPRLRLRWRSRFDERGLVPCVIQDWRSGEVLTLAYMNAEALRLHARDGRAAPVEPLARRAVAQGRDVGQHAGGQGAALRLRRRRRARAGRARRARPATPASGRASSPATSTPAPHEALPGLERTLAQRATERPEGSYTAELLADPPRIGEKVQEEAEEVVRAAREESDERVAEEAADVLYHLAVLLRSPRAEPGRRRGGARWPPSP